MIRCMPTILVALGLAFAAPAALATLDRAGEAFERMLASIDVVPSRAELERAWPDARERLLSVTTDAAREDWPRVRAASLLSMFPDPEVREALLRLGADPRIEVRRVAIYTAARAFGAPGDAALVEAVLVHVGDEHPDVGAAAIRGLRWVDHDAAERALEVLAAGDDGRRLSRASRDLARHTLDRRRARLDRAAAPERP